MKHPDLQVLLQAVIDAKDVQEQLSKINDLSIHIQKLNLDKAAINRLREQLSQKGIDLNLVPGSNTATASKYTGNNGTYIDSPHGLNTQTAKKQANNISSGFEKKQNEMNYINKLGIIFKEQISQAAKNLTSLFSLSSGITFLASKTKSAISGIKELDDTLTEISKTSKITKNELKELGMSAYDTADKYGKTVNEYLSGVESMSQYGFYGKNGGKMAEQSLLAQSAGGMSQETADKYIIATNAAYKFNGAAEKINAVLDGQNAISSANNITLENMAAAMAEACTAASGYNVAIEDLSAIIGTIEAVTKSGGLETGKGINTILSNLQNITSAKIPDILEKANASMVEIVNGAEKLRNPVEILRDLAVTFNRLDKNDPLRTEILTNVAGSYHTEQLEALLQNMDMFDKMLSDYSKGKGSAFEEAGKNATSLSGSLNTLSNSWTRLVNSVVTSDGLKTGVNLLDSLVQFATKLTNLLGADGTLGLGAGLFAGIKNVGRDKMFSLNLLL